MLTDWLSRPDRPTALIGYGHSDIDFALLAALRLGLSVPDDLSLLTFGSDPHRVGEINVTTLLVPEPEVGAAAVQMLLAKIADDSQEQEPRAIPFGFEAGATCVPPSHPEGELS